MGPFLRAAKFNAVLKVKRITTPAAHTPCMHRTRHMHMYMYIIHKSLSAGSSLFFFPHRVTHKFGTYVSSETHFEWTRHATVDCPPPRAHPLTDWFRCS